MCKCCPGLCQQMFCPQKPSHCLCSTHWKVLIALGFFHSILSSPLLSPGVTFSFFWKTQDQQAKLLPASGGRVISSGFKICSNEGEGSVEFYTRGSAMMKWKASFSPPGKAPVFKTNQISLLHSALFLQTELVKRAQLQEREVGM